MEIKSQLDKPYTDKQKIDFIVEQNHQNGYEIKETELALEAWGFTEEEQEEQYKQKRIEQIKVQLKEKDEKAIRSLRAKLAGVATSEDEAFLTQNEQESEDLRQQLKDLGDLK